MSDETLRQAVERLAEEWEGVPLDQHLIRYIVPSEVLRALLDEPEEVMSDHLNETIIGHLLDLLDNEPPQDAGQHPSLEVHERVGHEWAEWRKQVDALRVVLGVRLVNDALEAGRRSRRSADELRQALTETPPTPDAECCAAGRCEVCSPGSGWQA